jgi:predicted nucleotide-binding protein
MYNLIVSSTFKAGEVLSFSLERNRFLEATDDTIKAPLKTLSKQAIERLKSWPCIVINEGRSNEVAILAKIQTLTATASDVSVRLSPIGPAFTNEILWKARDALAVDQFEFNRNHWAIKERDLFVEIAGVVPGLPTNIDHQFPNKSWPITTRSELMTAKTTLAAWSHTDLDELLIEAGVTGMPTERVGSRRDRALQIIQYALDNPSAVTAANDLLSTYLVNKAQTTTPTAEPITLTTEPENQLQLAPTPTPTPMAQATPNPARVFVVHGRNDTRKVAVADLLTSLGLKPIVLHEQPNMGRHLLTKFIDEAELATFAVIVMSADDVGGLTPEGLKPRTRQNVILELGYFISHLGQARVCALIDPGLETPSDFDGIAYVPMDEKGTWQTLLIRELRAAGLLAA